MRNVSPRYTATFTDDEGQAVTVEGDTLAEVSAALLAVECTRRQVRVVDVAGFTVGWANATGWVCS